MKFRFDGVGQAARAYARVRTGWSAIVVAGVLAGCTQIPMVNPDPPVVVPTQPQPPMTSPIAKRAPKIGLALGGGAARGFAHVGVIQVLQEAALRPSDVAGTSAGSLVAAIYAGGKTGSQFINGLSSLDFSSRKKSIEAGRQAILQMLPQLKAKMVELARVP